ncbi:MAG: hypothetical protein LBK52_05290, partial [Deltaproteobacteria bacterium]|nr:hypothetical protein [Deltaproteobacteria bacterium]
MIKYGVSAVLVLAFLGSGLLAQDALWTEVDLSQAGGQPPLELTVSRPPDFWPNTSNPKKEVLRQFDRGDSRSVTYVNIARFDLDLEMASALLQGSDGKWAEPGLDMFWNGLTKTLDGFRSRRSFFYGSWPACEMELVQTGLEPDNFDRIISARLIIYGKNLLMLECGELAAGRELINHEETYKSVCRPFFDSLAEKKT